MRGEWLLIRLKPRGKERNENWLLRKIDDAEAGGTDVLTETALTSVATGRTMEEIAEGKSVKKQAAKPRKATAKRGATEMPAFSWASSVDAPRCGVTTTFGSDR